jgi:hypothetical protein
LTQLGGANDIEPGIIALEAVNCGDASDPALEAQFPQNNRRAWPN